MMQLAADIERLTRQLLNVPASIDTGILFSGEQSKQGRQGTHPSSAMLCSLALTALGGPIYPGSIDQYSL